MAAVLSPQRDTLPSFEPLDLTHEALPQSCHAESYCHDPLNFSPSSARDPVQIPERFNSEDGSLYAQLQNTPAQSSTHSLLVEHPIAHAGELNQNRSLPHPWEFTPLPSHDQPEVMSIQTPADISPAARCSHSASDLGHASRSSRVLDLTSPECVPAQPSTLTRPSPITAPDSLSDPLDVFHASPYTMEPDSGDTSSKTHRPNKLLKPRPRSPSAYTSAPSASSRLLSRAFGYRESFFFSRLSRINNPPNMDDWSYRPTRSLSDGNTKSPPARPHPTSKGSETADSSSTSLSGASTSLSYPSTALTTPDSVSSPGLSPSNSTRVNKLHKKRPLLAPSAYQYPSGRHSSALGRSKSTPNGLGQRSPKNRIWTSVEEARFAAENADESGGQELSHWHASQAGRSTLGPIFEVRRRRSSQAISDPPCTGICSSSSAALASQFALNSSETDGFNAVNTHGIYTEQFDPYVDCISPAERSITESGDNVTDSLTFPSPSPSTQGSSETSSSGFAVVGGYLDRSEDAMRRWTLAMADVPDEVLVRHLERLRKESVALAHGRLPGRGSAAPSQAGHGDDEMTYDPRDRRSSFFFGGPREMGISPRSASRPRFVVGNDYRDFEGEYSDEEAISDGEDEEDWKTARQVLFRCRELVQTERNYQNRLKELAVADLSQHFSSLVAKYIPALISVSQTLLAHVMDDPSAWGVSAAFIGCEEELESALVTWAGVAGEFFMEDANLRPPKKLTRKSNDDALSPHIHDSTPSAIGRVLRTRSQAAISSNSAVSMKSRHVSSNMADFAQGETLSSLGHESIGMFTAALGTGLAFGLSGPSLNLPATIESQGAGSSSRSSKTRSLHGNSGLSRASTISSSLGLSRAMTAWKRKSMPSSLSALPMLSPPVTPQHGSPSSAHGHGSSRKKLDEKEKKMTVRDLAIQPVQRVMRYVLQYRDLLNYTPITSPSRALVERAYESALRIAKMCDLAQAHAAFIHQSTSMPTTTPTKDQKFRLRPKSTMPERPHHAPS